MKHALAAKCHLNKRGRQRLGNRVLTKFDIDRMKRALLQDNQDCFLRKEYNDSITGIVRFKNRWTTALYDKALGVVKTVGCSI